MNEETSVVESEHPEMDRAAEEVAAIMPPPTAGDVPPPSEEELARLREPAADGDPVAVTVSGEDIGDVLGILARGSAAQAFADRDILAACLTRLARLHGVNIPGEHPGDIDTAGLSPEFSTIAEWAKTVRLS